MWLARSPAYRTNMHVPVLSFLFLQLALTPIAAFVGGFHQHRHTTVAAVPFVLVLSAGKDDDDNNSNRNDNNTNDDDNNSQFNSAVDDFLDRPFFDPDKVLDENNAKGPLAWFANLVKNDYALAETLYVGVFGVVLIVITQELLRLQLYGDAYVPFTRGISSAGGNLF
jgi:hypothetical protein